MNHDDVLRGLNSVIQRIKKNLQIVWVLTLIDQHYSFQEHHLTCPQQS